MVGVAKVQSGGFGIAKPGIALPLKALSMVSHLARCVGSKYRLYISWENLFVFLIMLIKG